MKTLSLATAIMFATTSAYANSATIEDALKSREDLSMFYQALMNSGVAEELESGSSYTVFAPTNEAFEKKFSKEKYPCFYSPECKAEVADIVRNHIVKGNYYISDARGALPNLDRKFINVSESSRNTYYVAGKHVETTHTLVGGTLYEIDGVIADDLELLRLESRRVNSDKPMKSMAEFEDNTEENTTEAEDIAEKEESAPATFAPAR